MPSHGRPEQGHLVHCILSKSRQLEVRITRNANRSVSKNVHTCIRLGVHCQFSLEANTWTRISMGMFLRLWVHCTHRVPVLRSVMVSSFSTMRRLFRSDLSWSQVSNGSHFSLARAAKLTNSSLFFPELGMPRCVKKFFNSLTRMADGHWMPSLKLNIVPEVGNVASRARRLWRIVFQNARIRPRWQTPLRITHVQFQPLHRHKATFCSMSHNFEEKLKFNIFFVTGNKSLTFPSAADINTTYYHYFSGFPSKPKFHHSNFRSKYYIDWTPARAINLFG